MELHYPREKVTLVKLAFYMLYFTSTLAKAKCVQSMSLPPQLSIYFSPHSPTKAI